MSEDEQSGREHDGRYWTGTGMNPERASRTEHPAPSWQTPEPEEREQRRIVRQDRPVPPGDRLAHLGHVEHPVQTYRIMKPVPNDRPVPADAEEWFASFGRVVVAENLPGGNGKTSIVIGTDPQGDLSAWSTAGDTESGEARA
ncbi:hypothetical protein OG894_42125 (plasmid) [Streptomyces sp. NBC_01724]|uniref:hypothetical protein n=1 Tax=Streptomyces sp. NBC_01724 TaxID=2975922 RepID=UPI002E36DD63|nr:hypothetical protein [Streptomyces sp. NBC_01724]